MPREGQESGEEVVKKERVNTEKAKRVWVGKGSRRRNLFIRIPESEPESGRTPSWSERAGLKLKRVPHPSEGG